MGSIGCTSENSFLGYVDMKELNVHDIMTYKDELDV
jgi:hypothetical protein